MDENSYRDPGSGDVAVPPKQKKSSIFTVFNLLAVLGIIVIMIALLLPAVRVAPEAARRNSCMNSLKQIALALHNYQSAHSAFPPAYTTENRCTVGGL